MAIKRKSKPIKVDNTIFKGMDGTTPTTQGNINTSYLPDYPERGTNYGGYSKLRQITPTNEAIYSVSPQINYNLTVGHNVTDISLYAASRAQQSSHDFYVKAINMTVYAIISGGLGAYYYNIKDSSGNIILANITSDTFFSKYTEFPYPIKITGDIYFQMGSAVGGMLFIVYVSYYGFLDTK